MENLENNYTIPAQSPWPRSPCLPGIDTGGLACCWDVKCSAQAFRPSDGQDHHHHHHMEPMTFYLESEEHESLSIYSPQNFSQSQALVNGGNRWWWVNGTLSTSASSSSSTNFEPLPGPSSIQPVMNGNSSQLDHPSAENYSNFRQLASPIMMELTVLPNSSTSTSPAEPEPEPVPGPSTRIENPARQENSATSGSSGAPKKKRRQNYEIINENITILPGNPVKYQCKACTAKPFKTKANCHYHAYCGRQDERPYKCKICGAGFITKVHFDYHARVHTGERPYKCPTCGRSFNQAGKLTRHKRTHTGERPFPCDVCTRTFANRQALSSHKLTHTGERPFSCRYNCGKAFTGQTNRQKHELTHSGERSFVCDECGKRFALKWTLDLHKRTHSGKRDFPCGQCQKSFMSKKDLNRHSLVHTGERPFPCPHCKMTFRRKDNMTRHVSNIHLHIPAAKKRIPLVPALGPAPAQAQPGPESDVSSTPLALAPAQCAQAQPTPEPAVSSTPLALAPAQAQPGPESDVSSTPLALAPAEAQPTPEPDVSSTPLALAPAQAQPGPEPDVSSAPPPPLCRVSVIKTYSTVNGIMTNTTSNEEEPGPSRPTPATASTSCPGEKPCSSPGQPLQTTPDGRKGSNNMKEKGRHVTNVHSSADIVVPQQVISSAAAPARKRKEKHGGAPPAQPKAKAKSARPVTRRSRVIKTLSTTAMATAGLTKAVEEPGPAALTSASTSTCTDEKPCSGSGQTSSQTPLGKKGNTIKRKRHVSSNGHSDIAAAAQGGIGPAPKRQRRHDSPAAQPKPKSTVSTRSMTTRLCSVMNTLSTVTDLMNTVEEPGPSNCPTLASPSVTPSSDSACLHGTAAGEKSSGTTDLLPGLTAVEEPGSSSRPPSPSPDSGISHVTAAGADDSSGTDLLIGRTAVEEPGPSSRRTPSPSPDSGIPHVTAVGQNSFGTNDLLTAVEESDPDSCLKLTSSSATPSSYSGCLHANGAGENSSRNYTDLLTTIEEPGPSSRPPSPSPDSGILNVTASAGEKSPGTNYLLAVVEEPCPSSLTALTPPSPSPDFGILHVTAGENSSGNADLLTAVEEPGPSSHPPSPSPDSGILHVTAVGENSTGTTDLLTAVEEPGPDSGPTSPPASPSFSGILHVGTTDLLTAVEEPSPSSRPALTSASPSSDSAAGENSGNTGLLIAVEEPGPSSHPPSPSPDSDIPHVTAAGENPSGPIDSLRAVEEPGPDSRPTTSPSASPSDSGIPHVTAAGLLTVIKEEEPDPSSRPKLASVSPSPDSVMPHIKAENDDSTIEESVAVTTVVVEHITSEPTLAADNISGSTSTSSTSEPESDSSGGLVEDVAKLPDFRESAEAFKDLIIFDIDAITGSNASPSVVSGVTGHPKGNGPSDGGNRRFYYQPRKVRRNVPDHSTEDFSPPLPCSSVSAKSSYQNLCNGITLSTCLPTPTITSNDKWQELFSAAEKFFSKKRKNEPDAEQSAESVNGQQDQSNLNGSGDEKFCPKKIKIEPNAEQSAENVNGQQNQSNLNGSGDEKLLEDKDIKPDIKLEIKSESTNNEISNSESASVDIKTEPN